MHGRYLLSVPDAPVRCAPKGRNNCRGGGGKRRAACAVTAHAGLRRHLSLQVHLAVTVNSPAKPVAVPF